MGAILTYRLRRGIVSAVVGGEFFHLPTGQDPSHVAAWEHQHDFRPGQYTLWDHTFVLPRAHGEIEMSAMGRAAPQTRCKIARQHPGHAHFGPAILIGNGHVRFYIHGWPPCNLKRCVVITYGPEVLLNVLAAEEHLSFAIEY
jgi:hypothetical protein